MNKPFLKWVGNKIRMMEDILPYVNKETRIVEPFVGSGSIFLNSNHEKGLLCDSNPDLINLYLCIQSDVDSVISDSKLLYKQNSKAEFKEIRTRYNASEDEYERAILLLYLNRHCFNGLVRYNQSGEFNVDYGYYDKVYFPEEELRFFAERSKNFEFKHQDFLKTLGEVKEGDIVVCDPPYVPLSYTANFTAYNRESFNMTHQTLLRDKLLELSDNNIPVIAFNNKNETVKELYTKFNIEEIEIMRLISCKAESRGKVHELLMHK